MSIGTFVTFRTPAPIWLLIAWFATSAPLFALCVFPFLSGIEGDFWVYPLLIAPLVPFTIAAALLIVIMRFKKAPGRRKDVIARFLFTGLGSIILYAFILYFLLTIVVFFSVIAVFVDHGYTLSKIYNLPSVSTSTLIISLPLLSLPLFLISGLITSYIAFRKEN